MLAHTEFPVNAECDAEYDVAYGLTVNQGIEGITMSLVDAVTMAHRILDLAEHRLEDIADDPLSQDEYDALLEALGAEDEQPEPVPFWEEPGYAESLPF